MDMSQHGCEMTREHGDPHVAVDTNFLNSTDGVGQLS